MLDNGYVSLAATRLALYRSEDDWGLVIEVFGFSPRAGLPDTSIYSFGSNLFARDTPEQYVSREAYERYLVSHPHNEMRTAFPLSQDEWLDPNDGEWVSATAKSLVLRGEQVRLPALADYAAHGIELVEPPRVRVFEVCRWLAAVKRDLVLATNEERRVSMRPEMTQLLVLDEWNHPNVVEATERPSSSETFAQLASVLETGDLAAYRPSRPPNTHWRNWPKGGAL
jgi:hypothetical protein